MYLPPLQEQLGSKSEVRDAIYVTLEILSNWGDAAKVGLTQVEFFDLHNGKLFVSPHDVDIRHTDSPGDLRCLINRHPNVSQRPETPCLPGGAGPGAPFFCPGATWQVLLEMSGLDLVLSADCGFVTFVVLKFFLPLPFLIQKGSEICNISLDAHFVCMRTTCLPASFFLPSVVREKVLGNGSQPHWMEASSPQPQWRGGPGGEAEQAVKLISWRTSLV